MRGENRTAEERTGEERIGEEKGQEERTCRRHETTGEDNRRRQISEGDRKLKDRTGQRG